MTVTTLNKPASELWRELWRYAILAAQDGRLGVLMSLPAEEVLLDRVYGPRREVLDLVPLPPAEFNAAVGKTAYFRTQALRRGDAGALARCQSFRRLAGAMSEEFLTDRMHLPVVLVSKSGHVIRRFDGTHRAVIARYLDYKTILCVAITADEYRAFQGPRLRSGPVREAIAREMGSFPEWYQSIEVLPGLRTRHPMPAKTQPVIDNLPDLTGQRVLDVGCNSGLYTFEAAACGAALAVGIDYRPEAIEQANWLRRVWLGARPEAAVASFVEGNILDRLDLLEGADTVIACCVLYHLTRGLHEFMAALAKSTVRTAIVQGNLGRARKSKPGEIEAVVCDGVTSGTPARLVFNLPQFDSLFAAYGFRRTWTRPEQFPIGIYEKEQ